MDGPVAYHEYKRGNIYMLPQPLTIPKKEHRFPAFKHQGKSMAFIVTMLSIRPLPCLSQKETDTL